MTGPPLGAPPTPVAQFFAWLLIVIGALLVVLCGGCTLVLWGVGVQGVAQQPGAAAVGALVGMFMLTGLIGGLPTAGGAILIWAGWRILRPLRTPKDAAKTFE